MTWRPRPVALAMASPGALQIVPPGTAAPARRPSRVYQAAQAPGPRWPTPTGHDNPAIRAGKLAGRVAPPEARAGKTGMLKNDRRSRSDRRDHYNRRSEESEDGDEDGGLTFRKRTLRARSFGPPGAENSRKTSLGHQYRGETRVVNTSALHGLVRRCRRAES